MPSQARGGYAMLGPESSRRARSLPIWPAMVITSVLFGISHFQALQLPALAAFGLVLSILAHRTGRLGRSIWAHVGFNATTVVLLLAGG